MTNFELIQFGHLKTNDLSFILKNINWCVRRNIDENAENGLLLSS